MTAARVYRHVRVEGRTARGEYRRGSLWIAFTEPLQQLRIQTALTHAGPEVCALIRALQDGPTVGTSSRGSIDRMDEAAGAWWLFTHGEGALWPWEEETAAA